MFHCIARNLMTYSDLRVVIRWQSRYPANMIYGQHTHALKLKHFKNNIDRRRRFFAVAVEDLCGVWLKPQRIRMNYQSRKRLRCTQLFHFHQLSKFHMLMHMLMHIIYKLLHEISLDFNFVQLLSLLHYALLDRKSALHLILAKFIALFPPHRQRAKWIKLSSNELNYNF